MISNQLTAQIMPSEKAPVAFKLKTAWCLKYKNVHQVVIFFVLLDFSTIRSRYVHSIRPMLGGWERYFSSRPFCLTRRQTWYLEVCLSAVCVVWCQNNNRKYITRNPTSISTFLVTWINWKKYISVYLIAFQALWKEKLFMYPPPLRKFVSFRPPYP